MKYLDKTLTPEERARDLVGRMTVREKVGQLNQRLYGFTCYEVKDGEFVLKDVFKNEVEKWGGLGVLYGLFRADPWSEKNFRTGLYGEKVKKAYNAVQKYVIEHSRFGIPVLLSEECPHGHQALDGYLLPVNLAMGCTFDPELAASAFSVCADELKERHIDFALVSMLDMLRDPRWGRSEECYSEDPCLASAMAAAVVKSLREKGVDVVAKHCCAQGETTGGINASPARIGERELREIHLPAVKAAVGAGAKGVMAAYNEIDGVPCHGNSWLLNDVLRGEFGFDGIVMADGCAVDRLGFIVDSREKCGALALNSGVDVSLWDHGFPALEKAVEMGLCTEERLDEAVMRVLKLKFEHGLFDNPYIDEEPKTYSVEEYPESLEAARQSSVLVKNENKVLPLKNIKSAAVIGPFAEDVYAQLGDYTAEQRDGAVITILEGIRGEADFDVYSMTEPFPCEANDQEEYIRKAVEQAERADCAVVVLGGSSSRFYDMVFASNGAVESMGSGNKYMNLTDCGEGVDVSDVSLPEWQIGLLRAVKNTGKPVVTVILAGRPYALTSAAELSDGMLITFYPGPAGGKAVGEILTGKVNPSGRLSASIPRSAGQIPVYYNRHISMNEDYADLKGGALYSFGYGLGYSEFSVEFCCDREDAKTIADIEENGYEITFTIKNDGEYTAIATPMLFIRHIGASVVPRVKELKSFTRVHLQADEERTVSLRLCADDFKVWNRSMNHAVESGRVELMICEGGRKHISVLLNITEN